MIARSGIETYQGLIHPDAPAVPFGFIAAPRVESDIGSDFQFIVPPEVLERHDVQAWRFTYKNWNQKGPTAGTYWFYVTHAEPLR